jgi:hypothetical protein
MVLNILSFMKYLDFVKMSKTLKGYVPNKNVTFQIKLTIFSLKNTNAYLDYSINNLG